MGIKLVGVAHGRQHIFFGVSFETLVEPDPATFYLVLSSLPEKTKVGIEWCPELCEDGRNLRKSINGEELPFTDSAVFYWGKLLEAINEHSLAPVFLDDFETMKKEVEKFLQLREKQQCLAKLGLEAELIKTEGFYFYVKATPEMRELEREIYGLNTELDYTYVIRREEKLLENIARSQPAVVFVGAAHSDFFVSQREELAKRGIVFDSYYREELFAYPLFYEPEDITARLNVKPVLDEETLRLRQLLPRRYAALTAGRILPDKTPKFIGTWDTRLPAQGLFEVYVKAENNGRIRGTIEDILGSAQFKGGVIAKPVNMQDGDMIGVLEKSIGFTKKYDEAAVKNGGAKQPIEYLAIWNAEKGLYEGKFSVTGSERENNFWLKEFTSA